ncbi:MAG: hypothetical protein ACRDUV_14660, partial [Pseudonocardiaceae bacterium]
MTEHNHTESGSTELAPATPPPSAERVDAGPPTIGPRPTVSRASRDPQRWGRIAADGTVYCHT